MGKTRCQFNKAKVAAIVLGLLYSWIFTVFINFYLLSLAIGIILLTVIKQMQFKQFAMWFIITAVCRNTVSYFTILLILLNPRVFTHFSGFPRPITGTILLGSEAAIWDDIVADTANYHIHNSVMDPFSGEPFKKEKDVIYSVGPDKVDNLLMPLYDPTNGVFSQGDIVVKHMTRGQVTK